jgi:hypothetical protein
MLQQALRGPRRSLDGTCTVPQQKLNNLQISGDYTGWVEN